MPKRLSAARRTLTASAVTSGPTPSPGRTAIFAIRFLGLPVNAEIRLAAASITSHLQTEMRSSGGRDPRHPGRPLVLVSRDLVGLSKGQPNIVEPFQQSVARKVIQWERFSQPCIFSRDNALLNVDRHIQLGIGLDGHDERFGKLRRD